MGSHSRDGNTPPHSCAANCSQLDAGQLDVVRRRHSAGIMSGLSSEAQRLGWGRRRMDGWLGSQHGSLLPPGWYGT